MPDTLDSSLGTSLSTSDIIPAESDSLADCEPWHMPALHDAANIVTTAGHRAESDAADLVSGPLTASKIENIRQQAHQEGKQEGFQQGYQQGMQQAEAETQSVQARLNQIMGQLAHPLQEQSQTLEQALVNLASALARAMVKNELSVDPKIAQQVAREAVSHMPTGAEHIRLNLNPNDVELVRQCLAPHEDWQLIPDPEVETGGCVVTSGHSFLDYSLDNQLKLRVETLLKQGVKQGTATESSPADQQHSSQDSHPDDPA